MGIIHMWLSTSASLGVQNGDIIYVGKLRMQEHQLSYLEGFQLTE